MTPTIPIFPRDSKGRAVRRDCSDCGNGTLQYEGDGIWRCDGLADPGHDDKPLIACPRIHIDGEDDPPNDPAQPPRG
jgi:hypothetical protein